MQWLWKHAVLRSPHEKWIYSTKIKSYLSKTSLKTLLTILSLLLKPIFDASFTIEKYNPTIIIIEISDQIDNFDKIYDAKGCILTPGFID